MKNISIEGQKVKIYSAAGGEYVSLTDISKNFGRPTEVLRNWLRNQKTLGYLTLWEQKHKPKHTERNVK